MSLAWRVTLPKPTVYGQIPLLAACIGAYVAAKAAGAETFLLEAPGCRPTRVALTEVEAALRSQPRLWRHADLAQTMTDRPVPPPRVQKVRETAGGLFIPV